MGVGEGGFFLGAGTGPYASICPTPTQLVTGWGVPVTEVPPSTLISWFSLDSLTHVWVWWWWLRSGEGL